MYDDVLYNRKPPYAVPGGVRDALEGTAGTVCAISNGEASLARQLFEEGEGIDILPAAAVAVAALQRAAASGSVKKDDLILLNITGGGVSRVREELEIFTLKSDIEADPSALSSASDKSLVAEIEEILGRRAPR